MAKAVVYDSKYGNTKKVAEEIAEVLEADLHKASDVKAPDLEKYDTIVFGSPTHRWNMSSDMKDLFKRMKGSKFSGKKGAAFDTKFKARFAGGAAKRIENKLKSLGFAVAMNYVSFYVTGMKGPLAQGEIDKAKGFVSIK